MPRTILTRFPITLSLCAGVLLSDSLLASRLFSQTFPNQTFPNQTLRGQRSSGTQGKPSASSPVNAPAPVAVAPSTPPTPAERPPHRAEVRYAQGQLAVTAENSSLNQILREIGRETGIKITGGVADERVFGTYGPSPASEVLAALLDGTGSNLLLIPSDSTSPGELILTPRHGGVTPPNPDAPGFDDDSSNDTAPFKGFQPASQAPAQPPAAPAANAPEAPAPSQPASSAPDDGDPQSPNAVKTPQQIYDQLQRLRQQRSPTPPQ